MKVFAVLPEIRETPIIIVSSTDNSFGLFSEYFILVNDKFDTCLARQIIFDNSYAQASKYGMDSDFMFELARSEAIQHLWNHVDGLYGNLNPFNSKGIELREISGAELLKFHLRGIFDRQYQSIVESPYQSELQNELQHIRRCRKIVVVKIQTGKDP